MMGAVLSLVLLAAALAMWALNLAFRLAWREELRQRRLCLFRRLAPALRAMGKAIARMAEAAPAQMVSILRLNDAMRGHPPGTTARAFKEKP